MHNAVTWAILQYATNLAIGIYRVIVLVVAVLLTGLFVVLLIPSQSDVELIQSKAWVPLTMMILMVIWLMYVIVDTLIRPIFTTVGEVIHVVLARILSSLEASPWGRRVSFLGLMLQGAVSIYAGRSSWYLITLLHPDLILDTTKVKSFLALSCIQGGLIMIWMLLFTYMFDRLHLSIKHAYANVEDLHSTISQNQIKTTNSKT